MFTLIAELKSKIPLNTLKITELININGKAIDLNLKYSIAN